MKICKNSKSNCPDACKHKYVHECNATPSMCGYKISESQFEIVTCIPLEDFEGFSSLKLFPKDK